MKKWWNFFKNKINVENDFIPTYLNVIVIKCDVAREQFSFKSSFNFFSEMGLFAVDNCYVLCLLDYLKSWIES